MEVSIAQGMKLGKRCFFTGWYFFEDLQNIKTFRIIMWIILSTVGCCLCAQWHVMNGEPTLQTSRSWPLKVFLWFACLCELIVYTIRQGKGKFSLALMSWTGSWKGLRSACLSGRKKYGESGEAGPASCSHELVKQLICLWSCSCDVKTQMLCLENTVLGFITLGWERD